MAKRTATMKAIDNINSYIRDVASVYGKNSQEYEDITNAVADYDLRTNKNGVLQVRNTKENRKAHNQLRAQARKAHKARTSSRYRKARKEFRDTAKKQLHSMQKAFSEASSELYSLRDLCEQFNIEWDYLKGYRDRDYVESKWKEVQRAESEYLKNLYGTDVIHDYETGQYIDAATSEVIEWGYFID